MKHFQIIEVHDDGSAEYKTWVMNPFHSDFEERTLHELGTPDDHFMLSAQDVDLANSLFDAKDLD